MMPAIQQTGRRAAHLLITIYQLIFSPLLPPSCRYSPSCSEYWKQAILRHGLLAGLLMGVRRLLRCHPLQPGGYDPVP